MIAVSIPGKSYNFFLSYFGIKDSNVSKGKLQGGSQHY